jgi:hypothetical protein
MITQEIATERLQRAVALLMAQEINTAIDAQNTVWAARDATWFAAMGRSNPNFTVQHIAPDNIYSGTIPSLMAGRLEDYPNCCVIAYIANPRRTDDDWMEHYDVTLAIELLVASRSQEEVNARIQRTVQAAHSVLTSDKNRRIPDESGENLVSQIANTPLITIGDVFVKHGDDIFDTDPQDQWCWQGGRLQYGIETVMSY